MDALHFRSQQEKHELSHLYEAKIRNMGNAGRNGGEYYTPRPLIRAMVKVLDHDTAITGDDLVKFVNDDLFPYLEGFKQRASGPDTIEYKIGEIFGEIKNKISSGYNLREIIDHLDELRFRSQTEKHELSHLYEAKIKNMGNAGRNGGEYYTPRPLIRAMVQVVKPKIGERIYDGACGSARFSVSVLVWMMLGASMPCRIMFMMAMTKASDFFSLP